MSEWLGGPAPSCCQRPNEAPPPGGGISQKCCDQNWDHSQPHVKVSSRSRLFPRRRSVRKQKAGKWSNMVEMKNRVFVVTIEQTQSVDKLVFAQQCLQPELSRRRYGIVFHNLCRTAGSARVCKTEWGTKGSAVPVTMRRRPRPSWPSSG